MSLIHTRKSRREFLQLAGFTTAGIALAACAPIAPVAPAESGESGATTVASAPTEVRVTHWIGELLDPVIPLVEEKYSVKIANEPVAFDEYWTRLPAQIASNTAADTVLMDSQRQYDFMKQEVLLAWDDYMSAAGAELSEWPTDLQREGGWQDGKIYTIGLNFSVAMVLWVNLQLAEEIGMTPPVWGSDNFDTWSFEDWLAFWQAGTKRSADGTLEQAGLGTNPITWGAYAGVYQWFKAWDVEWINDHFWDDTEFIGNSAENVAVCEATWALTAEHKVCPDDAESQLLQGGYWRAEKALCEWYFAAIHGFPEMQDHIAIAHMPVEAGRPYPIGPGGSWCVPVGAKESEAGQVVGLSMTGHDTEIGAILAETFHLPHARPQYYRDNASGFTRSMFEVQTSRYPEITNNAANAENALVAPWMMGSKAPQEWPRIMSTEMEKARLGQQSWQEAMDNTKAQVDPLLQAAV